MNCKQVQDLLVLSINDELSRDGQAQLTAHLQNCAACSQELTELRSIDTRLKNQNPPVKIPLIDVPPRKKSYAIHLAAAAVLIMLLSLFFIKSSNEAIKRSSDEMWSTDHLEDVMMLEYDVRRLSDSRGGIYFATDVTTTEEKLHNINFDLYMLSGKRP